MAPFNILQEKSNGINNISYLNQSDSGLFLNPLINDFFFGVGDVSKDIVELGIYDSSQNLLYFSTVTGSYNTTKINYLYSDVDGNNFVDFYYKNIGNFIQDKKRDLLFDVPEFLSSSFSISSSLTSSVSNNFYISVNPVINLFSVASPLVIKEISNSRKEIKFSKNFTTEDVENEAALSFVGSQIYLNGLTNVKLKSGIVQRFVLRGDGDINNIGFSLVKDGPLLGTGKEYTKDIIFKSLTGEILLDTTFGDFPTTLWAYNRLQSGAGCQINFVDVVDQELFRLNTEFLALDTNKFIHNQIYDITEYYLNSFNCVNLYNSTKDDNVSAIKNLRNFFNLSTEAGIYEILNTIFYGQSYYDNANRKQVTIPGILNYILNYLKFNYNLIGDFSTLTSQLNRINVYTIDSVLMHQNVSALDNPQTIQYYSDSLEYLTTLFNGFLYGCLVSIKSDFNETFKAPLRNALNFGNGNYSLILNSKINYTDVSNLEYIVKLKDALPDQYDVGTFCNISNITYVPFFQKINYIQALAKSRSVKLAYTNFNIAIQDFQPSISKKTSYYNEDDLSVIDSVSQQIHTTKQSTQFNLDFTNFSNFVVFSQALLRIKIFENKIIMLTLLNQEVQTLIEQSESGVYPSSFTQLDGYNNVISLNAYSSGSQKVDQINNIITSFDPYESYLYNQYTSGSFIYDINHKMFIDVSQSGSVNPSPSSYISDLEGNAYEYDKTNRDSLVNNTPEFISSNDDNQDYLKFLSMIGHHFDNIYLYVSNMNVYTQIGHDLDNGIPRTLISAVLDSFGMRLPPTLSGNIDDENIIPTYLTDTQSSGSLTPVSLDDKTKIIWKRILANLPQIYKTKGTEESITYILNCYGVTDNLITLKEFGGGYTEPGIDSWYDVSETAYLLQYVGNTGEYVRVDETEAYKSLDFKFSVKQEDYKLGNLAELYSKFDSTLTQTLSLGIIKSNDTSGMIYIILKDVISGSSVGFVTPKMSLFDGDITGIMLRKHYTNRHFAGACTVDDNIPVKYDIVVAKNNTIRDESSIKEYSFYLSGSTNGIFDTNNINIFGNNDFSGSFVCFETEYSTTLIPWLFPSENNNSIIFGPEHQPDSVSFDYSSPLYSTSDMALQQISKINFVGEMDKFTFSLVPVSNHDFYTKCINLNAYPDGHPAFNYDNTLFRFDLGFPIDISISSSLTDGYSVDNKNHQYSHISASVFNFVGSPFHISSSFNTTLCVSQSTSTFPYQTEAFDVVNQYYTAEVGPNRYENEKIDKAELISPETRLSPDTSLFDKLSTDYKRDSNKLGVFLAPIQERDEDILDFFGKHKIISTIATPYETLSYKTNYDSLAALRRYYYNNGNPSKILFNELFIMYQTYVDKSIFQTLINVLPGRNKIYSGILIEPSILERNRIPTQTDISVVTILSGDVKVSDFITSKFVETKTSEIELNTSNTYHSYIDNNWNGLKEIGDVPDPYQLGVYCEAGNGLVYLDGIVYRAYILHNNETLNYASDSNLLNSSSTKDSQRMILLPAFYDFILREVGDDVLTETGEEAELESLEFSLTDFEIMYSVEGRLEPFTASYYNSLALKSLFSRKVGYYTYSGSFTGSFSANPLPTWFVKSRQTSLTTISDPQQTDLTNRAPIISTIVGGPINTTVISNPLMANGRGDWRTA